MMVPLYVRVVVIPPPPTSPSISPPTTPTDRNGAGGAIYGELTTGSMQKVVDIMISHCGLGKDSVFIDVGAGLGKPNIHVAQGGRREM